MIGPFPGQKTYTVPATPDAMLALGVERRVLRACLLEPIAGYHRLVGWISVQRDPTSDLTEQLAVVLRRLGHRLGRRLWDEKAFAPLIASDDSVRGPPLDQVLATSTPRDLLRVWIAGLSQEESVAAARSAVSAAPARIVGASVFNAALDVADLAHAFSANRPDMLVITGGYDNLGPSTERPIYQLTRRLAEMLRRLPPSELPLTVYAGERWMAPYAVDLLRTVGDRLEVEVVDNLRPSPDYVQSAMLAELLTEQQWELAQRMAGFVHLGRWVTEPARIVSLESNFTQAVRAWMEVEELPMIHGLYFASNWCLHVLAERETHNVQLRYVEDATLDPNLTGWPPVTLVSGLPPHNNFPLTPRWWDRSGMMPVVAAVGQVAPAAMIHVLRHDLLARE
jgi:hypothetical protein